MNKRLLLLGFLLMLILSLPFALLLIRQKQNVTSKAAKSTTLFFVPSTSQTAPLQNNVGDTISLDLMITPGSNLPSFVRLQVLYDSTKLTLAQTNPFVINTTAFPVTVEGPITATGSFAISLSIGADPTKAIQTTTKVGTFTFQALAPTSTNTSVSFSNLTEVLSTASTDQAQENVLSTANPAVIAIAQGTVTGIPTNTPTPTGTTSSPTPTISAPTSTPTPTLSVPSSTPTPIPTGVTLLEFGVLLHGIGSAGDNPNPQNSSLSNKNPIHPHRTVSIQMFDKNNQQVLNQITDVNYDTTTGVFTGAFPIDENLVGTQSAIFNIKMKSDGYLRKLLPGIITIKARTVNNIANTGLVAGDINGDNLLNVLDYNILLDCGYGAIHPLPMLDPNSQFNSPNCQSHLARNLADLDDNGIIDGTDYNLFLRELSVQNGD